MWKKRKRKIECCLVWLCSVYTDVHCFRSVAIISSIIHIFYAVHLQPFIIILVIISLFLFAIVLTRIEKREKNAIQFYKWTKTKTEKKSFFSSYGWDKVETNKFHQICKCRIFTFFMSASFSFIYFFCFRVFFLPFLHISWLAYYIHSH